LDVEEYVSRLQTLEKREFEDALTLIELLSNITFFGGLKRDTCRHAVKGQCRLFMLKRDSTKKLPLATECRITECQKKPSHSHIELSNTTCAFCHEWHAKYK
jgi:hypothetical protein